jgi:hypothetical protein
MRSRPWSLVLAITLSLAGAGCGGSKPAATAPEDPREVGPEEATPEAGGCCCHYFKQTLVDEDYVESYEHETMTEDACAEEMESECVDAAECQASDD